MMELIGQNSDPFFAFASTRFAARGTVCDHSHCDSGGFRAGCVRKPAKANRLRRMAYGANDRGICSRERGDGGLDGEVVSDAGGGERSPEIKKKI